MNDQLQTVLAQLAEKFGTSVEHLWAVLLRQAFISGVMSLVDIVLMGLASYAFYRYAKWFTAKERDAYLDSFLNEVGHPMILMIGGAILGVIVCIAVPLDMYNALTAFTNPEFWALREIVHH